MRDRPAHRILRLLAIERVGDYGESLGADLLDLGDDGVELLLRPRGDDDVCSVTRQLEGDGASDASSAAVTTAVLPASEYMPVLVSVWSIVFGIRGQVPSGIT